MVLSYGITAVNHAYLNGILKQLSLRNANAFVYLGQLRLDKGDHEKLVYTLEMLGLTQCTLIFIANDYH